MKITKYDFNDIERYDLTQINRGLLEVILDCLKSNCYDKNVKERLRLNLIKEMEDKINE